MKLKLSSDPNEDKARKAAAALALLGLLGLGRSQFDPQAWAIGGGGDAGGGGQTYCEPLELPGGTWYPPGGTGVCGTTIRVIDSYLNFGARANICTPHCDCRAITINAYLMNWTTGCQVRAAIYRRSDGVLMGGTPIRTNGGGSTQWQPFDFVTPPALVGGVDYWLFMLAPACGIGSGPPGLSTDMGMTPGPLTGTWTSLVFDPLPSPISVIESTNKEFCINLDYAWP